MKPSVFPGIHDLYSVTPSKLQNRLNFESLKIMLIFEPKILVNAFLTALNKIFLKIF